uniref:Uncharacterized protein LOC114333960 n=1 Tax=Diabrotica virgifera virgifera TaxID=50390 RepID=A0A6P7FTX2_DIAVI
MQNGKNIEAMGENDMYKYLGVKQAQKIDHKQMKIEITTEFIRRVKQLLRSHINSRNLFKALNTYACSALSYLFGIVKWTKVDIENLQRKVRTHLTNAQKCHPRSAVGRTTLSRNLGGRGLMEIGEQLDKQIANLRTYFEMQAETSTLHRAICAVDDTTPIKLREPDLRINHFTKDEKNAQLDG